MIFDFSTGAKLIDGGGRTDLVHPLIDAHVIDKLPLLLLSLPKSRRLWNMPFVCLPTTCSAVDCHVNRWNKNKLIGHRIEQREDRVEQGLTM